MEHLVAYSVEHIVRPPHTIVKQPLAHYSSCSMRFPAPATAILLLTFGYCLCQPLPAQQEPSGAELEAEAEHASAGFGALWLRYVEGSPEIVRDGEPVHGEIEAGFPLEPYDIVRTGPDGVAEISFGAGRRLALQPRSTVLLLPDELPSAGAAPAGSGASAGRRDGAAEQRRVVPTLLVGLTSYTVSPEPGGNVSAGTGTEDSASAPLEIRMQAGDSLEKLSCRTSAGRGYVRLDAAGSVHVIAAEGRVECAPDAAHTSEPPPPSGRRLFALPGRAVQLAAGRITNVEYNRSRADDEPGELFRSLRAAAAAAAEEDGSPGSAEALSAVAERLDRAAAAFDQAYGRLMQQQSLLEQARQDYELKRGMMSLQPLREPIAAAFERARTLLLHFSRLRLLLTPDGAAAGGTDPAHSAELRARLASLRAHHAAHVADSLFAAKILTIAQQDDRDKRVPEAGM